MSFLKNSKYGKFKAMPLLTATDGIYIMCDKKDLAYRYNSFDVLDRKDFELMLIGEMRSMSKGWCTWQTSIKFVITLINNIHGMGLLENERLIK